MNNLQDKYSELMHAIKNLHGVLFIYYFILISKMNVFISSYLLYGKARIILDDEKKEE